MRRLMFHCWAIDRTVFVTQYRTGPAGKKANMNDITRGMNMNTLAWTGSGGAGFSLYWVNIAAAMMAGRTNRGSRADRSWIQNAKGAWRISTLSSRTQ